MEFLACHILRNSNHTQFPKPNVVHLKSFPASYQPYCLLAPLYQGNLSNLLPIAPLCRIGSLSVVLLLQHDFVEGRQ